MEGLDCYVPLVDDHGVDCVVKKSDGTFIEIQIKARSNEVTEGDAALFAAITHEDKPNFYFVFYSERMEMMWILSSKEFLQECATNKTGKNAGKHSIWFNGYRTNKETGKKEEYCKSSLNNPDRGNRSSRMLGTNIPEYGNRSVIQLMIYQDRILHA